MVCLAQGGSLRIWEAADANERPLYEPEEAWALTKQDMTDMGTAMARAARSRPEELREPAGRRSRLGDEIAALTGHVPFPIACEDGGMWSRPRSAARKQRISARRMRTDVRYWGGHGIGEGGEVSPHRAVIGVESAEFQSSLAVLRTGCHDAVPARAGVNAMGNSPVRSCNDTLMNRFELDNAVRLLSLGRSGINPLGGSGRTLLGSSGMRRAEWR